MDFVCDDGGRSDAGYSGKAGDCFCRAVAIVTSRPYKSVYNEINQFISDKERIRKGSPSSARNGVRRTIVKRYLISRGFIWTPTMQIGSGCKVHLRADELPSGRLIVSLSKHYTAVIEGVIHDIYDCSRDGTRCVYGYFK